MSGGASLNPSECAKAFEGHECVYCGVGTFYLVSPTSLQCDKCEKVLDLTAESMLDDSDLIVVVVQTPFGVTREFRVPRDIAPEELLRSLVQARILLEGCSADWVGADSIHTILQLLQHSMERLGILESSASLTPRFTNSSGEALVNGDWHWIDSSILKRGDAQ